MPSPRTRILIFLPFVILAALTLPRAASAQRWYLGNQFQNIALETANAFVADYSTNISSPLAASAAAFSRVGVRSVARDSEGRVRIVRAGGKYIVEETDGVATEIERLSITICDPTARTTITMDTATKAATVYAQSGKFPRIIKPVHGQGESFCANLFFPRRSFHRAWLPVPLPTASNPAQRQATPVPSMNLRWTIFAATLVPPITLLPKNGFALQPRKEMSRHNSFSAFSTNTGKK